jgi:hypothetical protein
VFLLLWLQLPSINQRPSSAMPCMPVVYCAVLHHEILRHEAGVLAWLWMLMYVLRLTYQLHRTSTLSSIGGRYNYTGTLHVNSTKLAMFPFSSGVVQARPPCKTAQLLHQWSS